MRQREPDDFAAERYGAPEEPSLGELADILVRRIVTAIVIAGALIALALYFSPSPPRYQVTAADGRIVRVDTRTGTVIACDGERCFRVLRRGQELDDPPSRDALPAPGPQAQPAPQGHPAPQALPAPQAQPAPKAAPAPAPKATTDTR